MAVYPLSYVKQGFNFSECGPCSLAMVLKQRDPSITAFTCRQQQTQPSWWRAVDIQRAAAKLGYSLPLANYTLSSNAGIYLSTYWGFGHWVVAWKEGSVVKVLDPKRGYYRTTESRFRQSLKSTTYVASDVRL